MLIQEEFSRLIYLYQQAAEGKNVSVQDVFHKSLEFIEHLKEVIQTGDEEDRKAAIRMMKELFEHMKNHTRIICEKTGVTEEELLANSENPANFTPEQWKMMQEDKAKLAQSSKQLAEIIQKNPPPKAESPPPPEKEQKKKKPKKSHWMRS